MKCAAKGRCGRIAISHASSNSTAVCLRGGEGPFKAFAASRGNYRLMPTCYQHRYRWRRDRNGRHEHLGSTGSLQDQRHVRRGELYQESSNGIWQQSQGQIVDEDSRRRASAVRTIKRREEAGARWMLEKRRQENLFTKIEQQLALNSNRGRACRLIGASPLLRFVNN
jgi:hypothetical protein